jgi:hypothetical protein
MRTLIASPETACPPGCERQGATLVEVLVAITIMGLGLLSILSLFVVGSVTMSQASQDDLVAHVAANAGALADMMDVRHDPLLLTPPPQSDVFSLPFPGSIIPDLNAVPGFQGMSYPVMVDPYGLQSGQAALGRATVNTPGLAFVSPGVPRCNVSFVAGDTQPLRALTRWFTSQDDMSFLRDGPLIGLPCPPGGVVPRENRYSWSYLLRRPRCGDVSVVDLTVIVYSGRPILPLGELAYGGSPGNPIALVPNTNTVVLTWNPAAGEETPPIRRGGWIFDATMVRANLSAGLPPSYQPDPHGHFYRVVAVTALGLVNGYPGVLLEVDPPIRAGSDQGVLVVMETVQGVFERGLGRKP